MRVLRWEVPVDDQEHVLPLTGRVLHTACRSSLDVVEVWTLDGGGPPQDRAFLVVGTGHPWPPGAWEHRGVALAGPLVWHLLERQP